MAKTLSVAPVSGIREPPVGEDVGEAGAIGDDSAPERTTQLVPYEPAPYVPQL